MQMLTLEVVLDCPNFLPIRTFGCDPFKKRRDGPSVQENPHQKWTARVLRRFLSWGPWAGLACVKLSTLQQQYKYCSMKPTAALCYCLSSLLRAQSFAPTPQSLEPRVGGGAKHFVRREFAKVWFPKGWFWRMFRGTKKTGTRVHSQLRADQLALLWPALGDWDISLKHHTASPNKHGGEIWAAAEMYYLNVCQSRFSGVYLVFKVFQEIWWLNKENRGVLECYPCPSMPSNCANSYLVPISFWSRSGCWPCLGFLFYAISFDRRVSRFVPFRTKVAHLWFGLVRTKMPSLIW